MKLPLLVSGVLALIAVPGLAADSDIEIEAEKPISIFPPFKKVANAQGEYLKIPWDQNKTAGGGSAVYKFNVETPGTYYLWIRTWWVSGCGNSVTVSIDKGSEKIFGEDNTYDSWHWVGGKARFALKKGRHTLILRGRETGVRVDKFRFTQDGLGVQINGRKPTR